MITKQTMDEIQNIKLRYKKRSENPLIENFYFQFFARSEREFRYSVILNKYFNRNLSECRLIEIGAGGGDNLLFFHRMGLSWNNLFANELLSERIDLLKVNLPVSTIIPGNALDLKYENYFDIVFQSTVFTSILDSGFRKELALKMIRMVKSEGLILWYDFKYNNPRNKDVKGVTKAEIRELFKGEKEIRFYRTTLAPPIGRRVGKLYNLINFLFPFFRTHLIALIKMK
jgi:hypothetical protein